MTTSTETAISIVKRPRRQPIVGPLLVGLLVVLVAASMSSAVAQTPGSSLLAKAAEKSGKPFKDCDECPEMVVIPPGNFSMGRDDGKSVETPAVPVAIIKSFALSRFEITWDQWLACVEAGPCTHVPDDHEWGRGSQPMMNVTWQDAKDYVRFLSERTGQPYRLPYEAEWEYA
ncbi:MAG: SUMF1/EgtB/PvdO family nonheme iron enzyme, partial [Alphaproteobacteria bacterium]|nr:SUMF1/EgtB/PvdO family nonheme iron enzyme [Alphaproteobacteria bacterium]